MVDKANIQKIDIPSPESVVLKELKELGKSEVPIDLQEDFEIISKFVLEKVKANHTISTEQFVKLVETISTNEDHKQKLLSKFKENPDFLETVISKENNSTHSDTSQLRDRKSALSVLENRKVSETFDSNNPDVEKESTTNKSEDDSIINRINKLRKATLETRLEITNASIMANDSSINHHIREPNFPHRKSLDELRLEKEMLEFKRSEIENSLSN
jgi:hypothetical protein